MAGNKSRRPKALQSGRPPSFKQLPSLSSQATRTLIRTHHTLCKQKAHALAKGDLDQVAAIEVKIEENGGLEAYQRASLLGQAKERGGDSSKVLMEWLGTIKGAVDSRPDSSDHEPGRLRLLEIGALSTENACSRSGLFHIERIDLNSQSPGIQQQDFMERPIPLTRSEQFDIISLSLVLNYVPDPGARGEMLKRTLQFLRPLSLESTPQELRDMFPCLFLVLPVFCITNSRYMDESRLEMIMNELGYVKLQHKVTNKLVYYLWKATDLSGKKRAQTFKKEEVRGGKTRNNFAIVLK
jgi:25S rRNA (adenine2142-N1)-methyltransferase